MGITRTLHTANDNKSLHRTAFFLRLVIADADHCMNVDEYQEQQSYLGCNGLVQENPADILYELFRRGCLLCLSPATSFYSQKLPVCSLECLASAIGVLECGLIDFCMLLPEGL